MGMIDTTAPDGLTVIRIDNTTGANLWMANHAVAISSCWLSIVCAAFTIYCLAFRFREHYQRFNQRLILMLAISDIAVQFLHMSDHAYNLNRGYVVDNWFCQVTGWYLGTLLIANALWVLVFCYYLHKIVVRNDRSHIRLILVSLGCYALPGIYHLIPLFSPGSPTPWVSYGPRQHWCYIKNEHGPALNGFLAIPVYVIFILCVLFYGHIIFHIRRAFAVKGDLNREAGSEKRELSWRFQKRLLGYPAIFFVQWLPLIIEFACVWAGTSSYSITVIDIFTVFFINSSGFLNFAWLQYNEGLIQKVIWPQEYPVSKDGTVSSTKSVSSSVAMSKTSAEDDDDDENDVENPTQKVVAQKGRDSSSSASSSSSSVQESSEEQSSEAQSSEEQSSENESQQSSSSKQSSSSSSEEESS